MGQYYRAYVEKYGVPIIVHPHDYNNGAKLMEHSYFGNEFVNVVLTLIEDCPSKVAWVGDYADEIIEDGDSDLVFRRCWGENVSCCNEIDSKPFFRDEYKRKYFVNHTKKEYISIEDMYLTGDLDICPLPILTSIGNGLGGGDYGNTSSETNLSMVGYWYLDTIEITDNLPDDYSDITEDCIF